MSTCKCWAAVLIAALILPRIAAGADPAKEAEERGRACLDKQDFDGAIAAFTQAVGLDPKDAKGYYLRGLAYGNKGDHDKAIADFTKAIELDPKDASALWEPGHRLRDQG